MKIKELQKTVNVAWSPLEQESILLAAGTAAQQLDVNVNSVLEVYSANLLDPGYDLELKVSQPSQYKFQKIIWTPLNNGLIVGGCEGGHLQIFSSSKLLNGENGLVAHQDKHTGTIRSLDFNPFQNNLLSSAASESEIFIWDLNNTSTPMAPGTKTQPLEDVQNVSWNRQVQHILCSVFSSRCVIWDLRKNEQIMKLSDSQSRVRWRAVQWHPEIPTQLWLASEDDSSPLVQLWDLRYATAPAKSLQVHNRGILGLSWCPSDLDMMISCGKDNKIMCWNPNSELPNAEILGEVATTIQWYSDVQWCPKNPALIVGSSLEGNVSIYSLFGGTHHQVLTSNKIADSFPGMDQFCQAPAPQQTTQIVYQDLIKPPKWMKKQTGVSFGFGGKLISFGNKTGVEIKLHQVVTEAELVNRANALEKTLDEGNYIDFCKQKADQMLDQNGRFLWYFIKANFEINPREELLNLLGYNKEDTAVKFRNYIKTEENDVKTPIENVTNRMASLHHSDSSEVEGDQSTDDSTDLSGVDNNGIFDTLAEDKKMQKYSSEKKYKIYKIPIGNDGEGLISEAILSGNIEAAVELCFESGHPAEALIIASTGGIDMLKHVQNSYLSKQSNELSNVISALVENQWIDVMSRCSLDSWKEALMAVLTHSDARLGDLCVKLGDRLQEETDDFNYMQKALLCYICAGNIEKLVEGWLNLRKKKTNDKLSTSELQDLVEIVMLLKKSIEMRGQSVESTGALAEFLAQYAGLLATQGALDTALVYLTPTGDEALEDLRDRLYYALGHKSINAVNQSRSKAFGQNVYGRSSLTSSSVITSNRLNQSRNSFSNPAQAVTPNNAMVGNFNTTPIVQSQPWNVPPVVSHNFSNVPTYPSFAQPLPQNTGQPQGASMPPPPPNKSSTINDNITNSQRPSSVGSQGSGSVTKKYVVDPSVNLTASYGPMSNYNSNTENSFSGAGITPYNSVYNNNQFNQNMQNQPQANISNQNFKPFTATQQGLGGFLNPIPPVEMGQQALPPVLAGPRNPTPPPGWNDPPPLSSSTRQNEMSAKHAGTRKWQKIINAHNNSSSTNEKNQPKSDVPKVAPITHPIFGAMDPNQNGYVDSNATFSKPPHPSSNVQSLNSISNQQQQPIDNQNYFSSGNQLNFKTQAISSQGYNQPNTDIMNHQSVQQRQLETIKQKAPLPEEYIYMQTVLDELKNQCLSVASDLRTKKKVQEITKRLEYLYDALREKRLSGNTINALNQIVQFLQTGDYGNALATHTQIVSGSDFSQTANFMPGIKVLVQTASELKVYLQ